MKKYVLTGGPCTGKTSVIKELEKNGYAVCNEVAREVLEGKKGFNPYRLEIEIFKRQMLRESELESRLKNHLCQEKQELFLDRGLVDVVAYSLFHLNYIPKEIANFDFSERYDMVFVLDNLPFIDDGIRLEKNNKEANEIHKKIIYAYKLYGYSPIKVPVIESEDKAVGIRKRAEFIIDNIEYHVQKSNIIERRCIKNGRML